MTSANICAIYNFIDAKSKDEMKEDDYLTPKFNRQNKENRKEIVSILRKSVGKLFIKWICHICGSISSEHNYISRCGHIHFAFHVPPGGYVWIFQLHALEGFFFPSRYPENTSLPNRTGKPANR